MPVLDFGCVPGGFSLAAARRVGPEGFLYAVDIHPLVLTSVRRAADTQGFKNIQVVCAGETLIVRIKVAENLNAEVIHDCK